MSGYVWQPVPTLGPWVDIPEMSARGNDLMRRNWELIDQAAEIVNGCDGRVTPEQDELLKDIWEETLDIERKYAAERAIETERAHRSWYVHAFGPNYEKELGWI